MLRRFRERRTLRAARKQANFQTHLEIVKSVSTNKAATQQPIFRSTGSTEPSIQTAVTMGLSVDEDEVFVEETSKVLDSMEMEGIVEMKTTQAYDLRSVMDSDMDFFDRVLAEKDEALLIASIELGFLKETLPFSENELKKTQIKVDRQGIEISIAKIALKYQEEELRFLKTSLKTETSTRKELQAKFDATQSLLRDRDEQVKSLQTSVQLCNRSAQMLAGFFTLGALITTDK
jgi:hypothetical protein